MGVNDATKPVKIVNLVCKISFNSQGYLCGLLLLNISEVFFLNDQKS